MASFSVLEFFLFLFKGRKKEKEKRRLFGTFFFFLEHFKSIKVHLFLDQLIGLLPKIQTSQLFCLNEVPNAITNS